MTITKYSILIDYQLYSSCLTNWTARTIEWGLIFTSGKNTLRIACALILEKLRISQILLWL